MSNTGGASLSHRLSDQKKKIFSKTSRLPTKSSILKGGGTYYTQYTLPYLSVINSSNRRNNTANKKRETGRSYSESREWLFSNPRPPGLEELKQERSAPAFRIEPRLSSSTVTARRGMIE
jgi:hypothetical protein